ncbi:hypothetical protein HPP92_027023 [Vanilla planifolia]|uniref:Uncharacterized protein n=1 Tax=Vanilla planifolia TaxID=51239 RepID=A0A835PDK0_VANPL|nr:hypothetical protein HPP92_027023 [Vanilla planifolia]
MPATPSSSPWAIASESRRHLPPHQSLRTPPSISRRAPMQPHTKPSLSPPGLEQHSTDRYLPNLSLYFPRPRLPSVSEAGSDRTAASRVTSYSVG